MVVDHTVDTLAYWFAGFVMWVSERVAEDGGTPIYFLIREEHFLKKVHDRVVQPTRYPLAQAHVFGGQPA